MKFLKRLLRSKIFWTVVVLLFIGGVVAARFVFQEKSVEYVTEPVKRGPIEQTVAATGQVKAATEIELNFKNPGTLSVVNAKVGDQVEAGVVLAQLRAGDLASSVERAQASLAEAQANLRKVKAGATSQDIAVYQANVDKAASDLASAKTTLDSTERTYRQALENVRSSALNDLSSAITKANISLRKVYDIIYFKGSANNFNTSNTSLYQKVVSDNTVVTALVDSAVLRYNEAKLNLTDQSIDVAISAGKVAMSKTSTNLADMAELLDYAFVTSSLLQSDIDGFKTSISTERVTTNTSIATVNGASDDIGDARLDYQIKVQAAENDVTAAAGTLGKAEADLNLRKAPSRPEDVAVIEAQVLRAQADLQLARDQYNETIVRAPIAGVVTEVNYSVGEKTSTDPVIVMLAKERYQIEVDIPESDIVKIGSSQVVDITLDAFSDADIFKGVVTTINPAQTEIQDVVYYRVTVTFAEEQPDEVKALAEKIKPGMTANVTVMTNRVEDALIIPLRAVKDVAGKKQVEILVNNAPVTRDIQLGLRGDDGQVQAISGVSEGELVITFIRNGK